MLAAAGRQNFNSYQHQYLSDSKVRAVGKCPIDHMSPTAELPVVRCCRSSYQDDVMTSQTISGHDASRQSYFPSPYTRGVVAPIKGGSSSSATDSPSSTIATPNVRHGKHSNDASRTIDESQSYKYRPSQSTGCTLPMIDYNGNRKHSHMSTPRRSSSENASGTSPRDGVSGAGSSSRSPRTAFSSPPKKQSRTSMMSSNDSAFDAARLANNRRDANHNDRRHPLQCANDQNVDGKSDSASVNDDSRNEMMSSTDVKISDDVSRSFPEVTITTFVPRSILALHRCHDCSMENVRTYVDGLELDPLSHRRHIGRSRCSRLLPSAAATAVLMGLSLSPRPSLSDINDVTAEHLASITARCREDDGGPYGIHRKCVRFEPVVHVFCDDTSTTTVHQLRASSEHSTAKSTTTGAGLLFPPLHSCTHSEDLPAVVQRYMVRSGNQQPQQQRRAPALNEIKPLAVELDSVDNDNECDSDDDDNNANGRTANANRLSISRHWKP